jgi:LmbE family N-acetylglucosaminyl deacetylase
MKYVYLAPHLDDTVLSCGGSIHRQVSGGDEVVSITVMAGSHEGDRLSPLALEQHGYWGSPPQPMALRRAEDSAALALLGTAARHLDYLDAVYRVDALGRWLYSDEDELFGTVDPGDPLGPGGMEDLAGCLQQVMGNKEGLVVYAPLAVGHHVDHQIVHEAARRLSSGGYRVAYYEDYPYAEAHGALESALVTARAEDWRCEAMALDGEDLSAKVSALAYYRTQLRVLFGSSELMASRVWAFTASRSAEGGLMERVWWPSSL